MEERQKRKQPSLRRQSRRLIKGVISRQQRLLRQRRDREWTDTQTYRDIKYNRDLISAAYSKHTAGLQQLHIAVMMVDNTDERASF